MSIIFNTENEGARLELYRNTPNGKVRDYHIQFKVDMLCRKTCSILVKDLLMKLFSHLNDFKIRAKLKAEIDYVTAAWDEPQRKTAEYSSSRDAPWVVNKERFCKDAISTIMRRIRQNLINNKHVEIQRIKCFVIELTLLK